MKLKLTFTNVKGKVRGFNPVDPYGQYKIANAEKNICMAHVQEVDVVETLPHLTLVSVSACPICAAMPRWERRVETALKNVADMNRSDIVGTALRDLAEARTRYPKMRTAKAQAAVEYLLQENQFRKEAMPWSIDDARAWLDGDDDRIVLSNMERRLEKESEVLRGQGASTDDIVRNTTTAISEITKILDW